MVHDVVASESLSSTYRCDHATVFPVGVTAGVTDYADNVWIWIYSVTFEYILLAAD